MKEIEIDFESNYSDWTQSIKAGLDANNLIFDTRLPVLICRSLQRIVIKRLAELGYRPKNSILYRKNLANKLRRYGLKVSIKSNSILWKYLEYFTDLTDYSKAFDVSIVISDIAKATKDVILVNVHPIAMDFEDEIRDANNTLVQLIDCCDSNEKYIDMLEDDIQYFKSK